MKPPFDPSDRKASAKKRYSRNSWIKLRENCYQLSLGYGSLTIAHDGASNWQVTRNEAGQHVPIGRFDTLESAVSFADSQVPPEATDYVRGRSGWRSRPITEAHIRLLYSLERTTTRDMSDFMDFRTRISQRFPTHGEASDRLAWFDGSLYKRYKLSKSQANLLPARDYLADFVILSADDFPAWLETDIAQLNGVVDHVISSSHDLVQRFLELATKTVSRRDAYGLENRKSLHHLIEGCMRRLAEKEGYSLESKNKQTDGAIRNNRSLPPTVFYDVLYITLERRFAEHYASFSTSSVTNDSRDGEAFELILRDTLTRAGFSVEMTPQRNDQGADLIATVGSKRIAIQAKDWKSPVGNSAVQEIVAALSLYGCNSAWVVTTSKFTESARVLAEANNVGLLEGNDLDKLVLKLLTGP
ncbi:MAG: restriction endonuclease [Bryobacteraceae bacterium]|nr:restriction endonuclease [Bryobacteraceae bacterium]